MKYSTRTTCRVCDGKLKSIYKVGNFAISDFTDKPQKGNMCPLELVECVSCSLLQLKHTADQRILFESQYWYKSGTNPVIVNDLKQIAESIQGKGVWIDIGANDGTLLSYTKRYRKIGVEPGKNLTEELEKKANVVIVKMWEKVHTEMADVISAIGMFYDSEDPNKFIKNVTRHLKEDGVFIAQLMTLWPMLRLNDVSNICHEHLEYYSYKSLVELFERNGLEIYKVEENNINGGSYRIYARHYKNGSIRKDEPTPNYEEFREAIERTRFRCVSFISEEVGKGKKVYAYGASTKGNTILQYYYLDSALITGVADRNPDKWGKYTVGTKIPIVSEEEARKNADYFLILPYSFTDMFIEREQTWLQKGGQFITIIPNFKVHG